VSPIDGGSVEIDDAYVELQIDRIELGILNTFATAAASRDGLGSRVTLCELELPLPARSAFR
jgi:hypothetical protein